TEEQWLILAKFYLDGAPKAPLPQTAHDPIEIGMPGFKTVIPKYREPKPATTAVRIMAASHQILLADDREKLVRLLDSEGGLLSTLSLSNSVTSFRRRGDTLIAAAIGTFLPSDEPRGEVFRLNLEGSELRLRDRLITGLPRTTDADWIDLNGDGRPDCLVSCFGNNLGRMSWYEALPKGGFAEHVLFSLPGALHTEVADFNGDGRPDIAVLVAQETEALFIFQNDGKGGFERKTVFQRPPYFGHSHFELADFNGDGRPDFLVTNGDNGEFHSPAKRCHGVRIYASQPDGTWKESYFFPLNGAYKAVARDFDGDGDLDIAAISFFPAYDASPRESFVYLENLGNGRFRPSTFSQCITGRWITLDAGDIDGDGDDDLVLGSYIHGPTPVPTFLMDLWEKGNLPVIILRNEHRQPSAK
ncbi:MAG TPA: VCBS repeat-containing protein, partial [Candidatus Limnocylindria bacterium]|nr:VCBS repeat-containing protein [Candidatus Limnocylindria bacterium]